MTSAVIKNESSVPMPIEYPRECEACDKSYSSKQSFSNHLKNCQTNQIKRDKKITVTNSVKSKKTNIEVNNYTTNRHSGNTINTINSGNTTTNNIIINNSFSEIKALLKEKLNEDMAQDILNELQLNNLKNNHQIIQYLNNNVPTKEDIIECFERKHLLSDNDDEIDKKLNEILQESITRPATDPLHLLFRKVFLHVSVNGDLKIENLSHHIIRKSSPDNMCEILDNNDDLHTFWAKKHMETLLGELLFFFGNRLYEVANKNDEMNSSHPFVLWWKNLASYEFLPIDEKGKKLIDSITADIVSNCNNNLIKGWHMLIECYSFSSRFKIDKSAENHTDIIKKRYIDRNKRFKEVILDHL